MGADRKISSFCIENKARYNIMSVTRKYMYMPNITLFFFTFGYLMGPCPYIKPVNVHQVHVLQLDVRAQLVLQRKTPSSSLGFRFHGLILNKLPYVFLVKYLPHLYTRCFMQPHAAWLDKKMFSEYFV